MQVHVTGSKIHPIRTKAKQVNVTKQQTVQLTRKGGSAKAKALLLSRKKNLPAGHPEIGDAMMDLAYDYSIENRHGESLLMYAESVTFFKRVLREDDPKIGKSMFNLAYQCSQLGMYDEALII